jgi:hypothetical protein
VTKVRERYRGRGCTLLQRIRRCSRSSISIVVVSCGPGGADTVTRVATPSRSAPPTICAVGLNALRRHLVFSRTHPYARPHWFLLVTYPTRKRGAWLGRPKIAVTVATLLTSADSKNGCIGNWRRGRSSSAKVAADLCGGGTQCRIVPPRSHIACDPARGSRRTPGSLTKGS